MTRLLRSLARVACGLLLLGLVSCAHTLAGSAITFRVDCNVPDATVWIDDVLVGKASDFKKDDRQIKPGFHRVEVRHPNYYSFFQEVELPGGSKVVVNAKLRELVE
jgi:PEGA domain-containing protein